MKQIIISYNRYKPNAQYVEDILNHRLKYNLLANEIRQISLNTDPRVISITVRGTPLFQSWTKSFESILNSAQPQRNSKKTAINFAITSIINEAHKL